MRAMTGVERPTTVARLDAGPIEYRLEQRGELDQSLILYGGGMGDGNLHRHSNLPCLMAGKLGGQFQAGRHLAYPLDTPMSNLLLTILHRAGARIDKIGDSTGPLEV